MWGLFCAPVDRDTARLSSQFNKDVRESVWSEKRQNRRLAVGIETGAGQLVNASGGELTRRHGGETLAWR